MKRIALLLSSLLVFAGCVPPDELPEIEPACRELPQAERAPVLDETTRTALVLYDSSGPWGDLGPLYATMVVNLLGHFPEVRTTARPMSQYVPGDLLEHDVIFYMGVVYGENKPPAFMEDFLATDRTVVWLGQNLWQVANPKHQGFRARYGLEFLHLEGNSGDGADTTFFKTVHYKGEQLQKYFAWYEDEQLTDNDPDLGVVRVLDPSRVEVHAEIEHSGTGERIPYALRSGNLWYVADNPFTYLHELDRYLAVTDLMHDFVGLDHEATQLGLFRLEDVHPWVNPNALRDVIDVLDGRPWNMAMVPVFADPLGVYNDDEEWHFDMLSERAEPWLEAVREARDVGAEMVLHGFTHQFGQIANPFNGVTGTDFEFWDAVNDRPVPGDSFAFAADRVDRGTQMLADAGFAAWAFEVPHYQGSMVDYFAFTDRYPTVYHQGVYREFEFLVDDVRYDLNDVVAGRTEDLDMSRAEYRVLSERIQSQPYTYPVERDVYGQRVIPENLRNVTPAEMVTDPTEIWLVSDMLAAARANRVNRCAHASLFYHPFIMERPDMEDAGGPDNLRALVEGIEDLGYEFVQACALEPKRGIEMD